MIRRPPRVKRPAPPLPCTPLFRPPAADILAHLAPRTPGADTSERDELLHGLVNAARIVEVNDRTARLVGGNRGRALMAGQSVAAFWPLEDRKSTRLNSSH